MKKEDDIRLLIEYIKLNATLMRIIIEQALKDDKEISKTDIDNLRWYLNRIDYNSNRIKELAEQ